MMRRADRWTGVAAVAILGGALLACKENKANAGSAPSASAVPTASAAPVASAPAAEPKPAAERARNVPMTPGTRVRARRTYDKKIRRGMLGVYWGTNGGDPPAFVLWDKSLGSGAKYYTDEGAPTGMEPHAYWVPWNIIEIVVHPGMKVRAVRAYDGKIRRGMVGEYWGTNGGNPPAFVIWENRIGASPTYWSKQGAPLGQDAHALWVPWNVIVRD